MEFEKGDLVRVKADSVKFYTVDFQRRIKDGRVGFVRGHVVQRDGSKGNPLITLIACGRKKEYDAGEMYAEDLERAD